MNILPSLLLVLVVATHYGPDLLASYYPDPGAASRAWFYVARGVEGAALFMAVWWLSCRAAAGQAVRCGIALACAWGALEEAQTAACRLAIGIDRRADPGLFAGLCDFATGHPVYMLTISTALVVATLFTRGGEYK